MNRVYIDNYLYYNSFVVGNREVFSPCNKLKEIQKEILNIIKCNYKIRLNIKSAAIVHCNQKWILKIDIKDFYSSVPEKDIKSVINKIIENNSLFSKEKIYKYTTIDNKLPVGAVTSAHIANLAFSDVDSDILKYCRDNKINYSRYMDDLFFSSNNKSKLNAVEDFVLVILDCYGYKINPEKLKYISSNFQQNILGLVVNNSNIKIKNLKKREYRSLFFNYLKSIYFEERLGISSLFIKKNNFSVINGYLSYIKENDFDYFLICKKFIKSKIKKFGIQNNSEIKKILKILK